MECNITDIKGAQELMGQIGHHVLIAGHLALFGDIDGAEKEMQHAIDLLKSTES